MADNTKQYEEIVALKAGLDALLDTEAFVAGDLLWYPVQGRPDIRQAPDVLVAFGRPRGHRGSYQQWNEADIAPQVVFEILSPGNRAGEMQRKLEFYERHGVEEYYLYDPDERYLSGWVRDGAHLRLIDPIDGWTSPRLGVRFETDGVSPWRLRGPDGAYLPRYDQLITAQQRAERLEAKLRALGIDPDSA